MSASKVLTEWGVMVEAEAAYGDGATMVAGEDGLLALERPDVDYDWLHDGQRRGESGPMSHGIKRVGKSGLFGNVPIVCEAHGAGEAYSASKVPNIHDILVACGFTGTVDTTPGSEKYTYVPGAGVSAGIEVYNLEHKYILKGCYGDLSISSDAPDVPAWEFAMQGLLTQPSEAAVPSITYPTVVPPKAVGISFTLGNYTGGIVRGFDLSLNHEISSRVDQNVAAGHGGFTLGGCRPTLNLTVEADAFTGDPYHGADAINPYQLAELATALALSFQIGSTQYNKWKLEASAAQIVDVEETDDGPSGLWVLTIELNPTTSGGKDNLTLTFD